MKQELPVVFVEMPACPSCASINVSLGGGTVKQKYGKTQYAACLECGERFKVVWEIPPDGDPDSDSDTIADGD